MTSEIKLYGVSYGDGNNGVSQMYPDFFVRTNDPWRLARLAAVTQFKVEFQDKAIAQLDVDGEADFTIYANIYEPLDVEEGDEGYGEWSEANGAWSITIVFPATDEDVTDDRVYASLEECFDDEILKKIQN
jgi:hypothetical protein